MREIPGRVATEFTAAEYKTLRELSSPQKIQDFLDSLPINFEKQGDTYYSPRKVLSEQKAHCMEGALLAATALWLAGEKPLLLDLKTIDGDDDHVVALYRRNGYWGAISKTNHAVLRFRDPVYKTLRELATSYFHEYFLNDTGQKTLRSHSTRPFNLSRFGTSWMTSDEDLWNIAQALDEAPHSELFPARHARSLRIANDIERKAGELVEWTARDPRT